MDLLNKRTIYTTIVLILIIIAASAVWFFFGIENDQGERDSFFGSGSPFGEAPGSGGFQSGGNQQEGGESSDGRNIPRLYKITDAPIAGASAFSEERGEEGAATSTSFVRYMERGSGNVFDVSLPSFETRRLTNTTIPRVHEAYWGEGGSVVVARYLDSDGQTIKTFVGNVPEFETETDVGTLEGFFLPENISGVALSPNKTDLTYLTPTTEGVNVVQAPLSDIENSEIIFSFPFSEWLVSVANDIFLTTKPSGVADGYAYSLGEGGLERVVGDIAGLTINPSPGGNFILHTSQTNTLSLEIKNTIENGARQVPFDTLPEKCVWNDTETTVYCGVPQEPPDELYPDAWYQGAVLFNDSLESFSTETNTASSIATLEPPNGEQIDLINPFLGPEEKYLFFMNKHDGSFWSFRLYEESGS